MKIFSLGFIIVLIIGYLLGTYFPQIGQKVGLK